MLKRCLAKVSKNPAADRLLLIPDEQWNEDLWDRALFILLSNFGRETALVGTDVNPASVALFKVYCSQILKIKSHHVFAFLNSVTKSITREDLNSAYAIEANSMYLNIFFRVVMDLEEEEVLQLFSTKSQDMTGQDALVVTLVEESPEAFKALAEARLKMDFEGKFFSRYVRVINPERRSSVLLLKSNRLPALKKYIYESGLDVFGEEEVTISIDLGKRNSTPFPAKVIAFQAIKD